MTRYPRGSRPRDHSSQVTTEFDVSDLGQVFVALKSRKVAFISNKSCYKKLDLGLSTSLINT